MIFLGFFTILCCCLPHIFPSSGKHHPYPTKWVSTWIKSNIVTKLRPQKLVSLQEIDSIVTINLVISGIQAGISIPKTLAALSEATGVAGYRHTANALLQGIPWSEAWDLAPANETSKILSQALAPAWENGVNPNNILAAAAIELREKKLQRARQASEKLSVKLILPLGLCYLPAFILLGISPIIISGLSHF